MAGFVPTSARELYQRMLEWKEMRGTIACNAEGDSLIWIVADDLRLEISIWGGEGSIYVFDCANRKKSPLTHWHTDTEDIYEEMKAINEGKTRFAYVNTIFGKQIAYIGEGKSEKFRLNSVRYLGEEHA